MIPSSSSPQGSITHVFCENARIDVRTTRSGPFTAVKLHYYAPTAACEASDVNTTGRAVICDLLWGVAIHDSPIVGI